VGLNSLKLHSIQTLEEKFYPVQYKEVADSTSLLQRETRRRIRAGGCLLDIGAGSGRGYRHFYGVQTTGIDVSDEVLSNPFLDHAIVADASALPLPDCSFDTVISDYAFEHLDDPCAVIREAHRVLRPGGHFLLRTVNKLHYAAIAAALIPNRFHGVVTPWAQKTRAPEDVFPTRYRLNTQRSLTRQLTKTGFEVEHVWMVEGEPAYLHFSRLLYLGGVIYERTVNSTQLLSFARAVIVVAASKLP
jgi:ubiquinone/menaquinone biosynthesis C-methylase UbiE